MVTKLLLVKDVEDLGRSGDLVKVKPGYARNFLLPKKLGVIADKRALRMQEKLQEERRIIAAEDRKASEKLAEILKGVVITSVVKVDQEGHMYGSVTALDIVHLLRELHKVEIDRKSVLLKHPIKALGDHTIELKLKEGVPSSVVLKVVAEGKEAAEEAPAETPTEIPEEPAE